MRRYRVTLFGFYFFICCKSFFNVCNVYTEMYIIIIIYSFTESLKLKIYLILTYTGGSVGMGWLVI